MNQTNSLLYIQREFHRLCRIITYVTVAKICIFALLSWWLGVEVKGNTATLVGLLFIALAVFIFKIPYVTYRYMLKKYKDQPEKLALLGANWREFKENTPPREI